MKFSQLIYKVSLPGELVANLSLGSTINFKLYIYCELSPSKTVNLCLDISEFVVVLSFGDSEGVTKS